eukprot:CAMPEP_0117036560 /NCGR_PEP_ID=MMETSP0472-20121206/25887_1 /TAXON_ID=693140 ORGANISM="Tiarina fusus, Strain LIS" /NCGR_SAMPLE_ID=MMETSP0472 /ASSEMBLY_ACC=CAM_ASM_000603 /LENGTH=517 /DNA_ID=CAMNT_0004746345 /DNA_START=94 /DNA_END=1643 /DNA_ORIENTATION=-
MSTDCGSLAYPCDSLHSALLQIEDSNVVIKVEAGIYDGYHNINLPLPQISSLRIESYGESDVTFDCESVENSVGFSVTRNLELVNFQIANCTTGIVFESKDADQLLKISGVLISDCENGIAAHDGNLQIEHSELLAISTLGLSVIGSQEFIHISDSYFEQIPQTSMFIEAVVSEINLSNNAFISSGTVVISVDDLCEGSISGSEFLVGGDGAEVALHIVGGFWKISDIVMLAIGGSFNEAIRLQNLLSGFVATSQVLLGEIGIHIIGGNVKIADSQIQAKENGIYCEFLDGASNLNIDHIQIDQTYGDAIIIDGESNLSTIIVTNSEFVNSSIRVDSDLSAIFENCQFSQSEKRVISVHGSGDWELTNVSFENTGGIEFIDDFVTASLQDCSFLNNNGKQGGAIYFRGETLTLVDCTFHENAAVKGGAVYVLSSTCVLEGSVVFEDNSADDGAAIYCDSAIVENNDDLVLGDNDDLACEVVVATSNSNSFTEIVPLRRSLDELYISATSSLPATVPT